MKKFSIFLSLLSLLSTSTSTGFGQGRPRRVGESTSSIQQTHRPAAPAPTRATRARWRELSEQPQPANHNTDTTPAGPEEVDAGDIIRVNTTLVTIPVSVMDRDGRYVPTCKRKSFAFGKTESNRKSRSFSQSTNRSRSC